MIVGIDLGTTNSLVACINRENKPEIIINERGSRVTPSVIYFKNDLEVLVGDLARSQQLLHADRTVSCIKRHMGSSYQVDINGRGYSPVEISSLILRKLMMYAQNSIDEDIEGAVVTVPAYFNDNQRQATYRAGEMAGLKIYKLLNEPTAAALAYATSVSDHKHILVLDIGGGTFDITLMERDGNHCRVLATGGSTSLGGIDFDRRLVDYILQSFQETHGIDLSNDAIAMQQIVINAEKAKIDLSTINECSVLIPYISLGTEGPLHLNQLIHRQQFDYLCCNLYEEIEKLIMQTLTRAGVTEEWVDSIVLAGGSSRMPGYRERVARLFKDIEIRNEINPDEVVALGAAQEAGMISGNIKNIILHDATSHTLGIEDDQGDFVPLIMANTSYPVIESKLFTTVEDDQEEVTIHILQRDEMSGGDYGYETIPLGRFHLTGIKKGKVGEPSIDVTLEIDCNGILNVAAVDIDTGIRNEVQISESGYKLDDTVNARRGRNLKVL